MISTLNIPNYSCLELIAYLPSQDLLS